ncbi:MAG: hypothetical protein IKO39_01855 [Treponema sp.]|nr:hypothetical protein [Treponema sp.]
MIQEADGKTKAESRFFRATETFSLMQIPYELTKNFYDEKTGTAYVLVSLSRSQAEKILEEAK